MDFRVGRSYAKEHMEQYRSQSLAAFIFDKARGKARYHVSAGSHNQKRSRAQCAESGKKILIRPITKDQQKHVHRLLAKWIACHFRPFVIVEDEGFIAFAYYITHDLGRVRLDFPKRIHIRHEIVILAADLRTRIQDDIATGCTYFSLTSDMWTARNARSYISLTIHYVDDNFCSKNWTLEVRELPGIHDGKSIAAALLVAMMEDWSLSKDYCTLFLRNSGSNIVKEAVLHGLTDMSCVAPSLHLVSAGALIKGKASSRSCQPPLWSDAVELESDENIPDNEEDEQLSKDDRVSMTNLRELAISDMGQYIDEAIS